VPGAGNAGAQTDAIVELLDLYPTFAELSGLGPETPSILQGKSLLPLLRSPGTLRPGAAAYTLTSGGASLRTDRWRYTRWGENATVNNEELYDHGRDPGEHRNLARVPAYEVELQDLRARFEERRRAARRQPR
jgi:arylsulfatase A-like enzyme